MKTTKHIAATKISLTINHIRYSSNLDDNIRFQINGGYIRRYYQTKHNWSNRTWDSINLPAFGRHLKSLPLPHHTAHIKFIHNKLPLGVHQHRLATTKDPAISLCPCCKEFDEDQHHLLQCTRNPAREAAINLLMKTLIGTDEHPYGISIAASIDKHLKFPRVPVTFSHQKLPTRYHEDITAALNQQNNIGWHQLMQGFIALQWLQLASRTPLDDTKPDVKRGNYHTHLTLKALHTFTRSIWLGRNDMLHKHAETSASTTYSAESAKIRHYFANPLLLLAEDRHYVSASLDKLLRSRPSVRRRWLRRVRSSRASMLKHGKSQLKINSFFHIQRCTPVTELRPSTPPVLMQNSSTVDTTGTAQPPPPQPLERTPGRPPDTAPSSAHCTAHIQCNKE